MDRITRFVSCDPNASVYVCMCASQGAYYTFESWQLNHVPICLYLMTHAYFMFYHALANVVLRKVIRMTVADQPRGGSASKAAAGDHWSLKTYAAYVCTVFLLSYATAFMETLTIANFKYYTFVDKGKMYRYDKRRAIARCHTGVRRSFRFCGGDGQDGTQKRCARDGRRVRPIAAQHLSGSHERPPCPLFHAHAARRLNENHRERTPSRFAPSHDLCRLRVPPASARCFTQFIFL